VTTNFWGVGITIDNSLLMTNVIITVMTYSFISEKLS